MAENNEVSKDELNELVDLMKSIQCMTSCNEKVEMYNRVAQQFGELSAYNESEKYEKECIKLAQKTLQEIKKQIYSKAVSKKESAKLSSDYKSAGDEFRKVKGYLDADDLALECEQLRIKSENKSIKKRVMIGALTILILLLAIVGTSTSSAKYYYANVAQQIKAYDKAIKVYKKLGDFKDSEERLIESQYQNGLDLAKEGNYKAARKAFEATAIYKDSDLQKVKMEKLIISNAKPKDIVKLGNTEWKILDIRKDRALVMKQNVLPERSYNEVTGDITWEHSSIRKWLNAEYLESTFSEEERKNIILSDVINNDNPTYGAEGGNDTKDYIFLLSIEDIEQYGSLFPKFKNNFWLRSPGNSPNSAAFLSVNGQIMEYGYVTTSMDMKIRPAFWFNIN